MKPTRESILADAMTLSEADRAALAEDLLQSLDPQTEAGIEAAWASEIARRSQEIDSGTAKLIPWHEVRKELRGMIRGRTG